MTPEQVPVYLWAGQARLLDDSEHTELGIVSGVGYGKSTFGPKWHHDRVLKNRASRYSLITAPTNELLRTVNLQFYRDYLEAIGWSEGTHYEVRLAPAVSLTYWFGHEVLFRSAETHRRIVSYNISHAWGDEAGICPPEIRREVMKRLRCPAATVRQVLWTGTPEGMNWYADLFSPAELTRAGRHSFDERRLVLHGASFDNCYLPETYFDNLRDAFGWNENLWRAYVLGEFVPLFENQVYEFRDDRNIDDTRPSAENRTLYLSWDFNVGQVSWGAYQSWGHNHHLVAENRRVCRDTDAGCDQFLEAFPPSEWQSARRGHLELIVTGDAAGYARDTRNRIDHDYAIIEERLKPHFPRLRIAAPSCNPPVSGSVIATNRLFVKEMLKFNRACTKHIHSARSCVYDGRGNIAKPSKDTVTHPMDDTRYFVQHVAPALDRTQFGARVSF